MLERLNARRLARQQLSPRVRFRPLRQLCLQLATTTGRGAKELNKRFNINTETEHSLKTLQKRILAPLLLAEHLNETLGLRHARKLRQILGRAGQQHGARLEVVAFSFGPVEAHTFWVGQHGTELAAQRLGGEVRVVEVNGARRVEQEGPAQRAGAEH